jgi:inorganic pyrophosphatase
MEGKTEAELPCNMEDDLDDKIEVEEDLGPTPSQVADVAGRPETLMGMMPKSFEHLPKQKDNNVTVTIDEAKCGGFMP